MPNETISVVYERLDSVAGISFYHETLVYTNSSGQQFLATAAHSADPAANNSNTYNLSQASDAAAINGSSVYGTLTTQSGSFSNFSSNQLKVWLGTSDNPNPSEMVASGTDLSGQWSAITSAYATVGNSNIPYSPLSQNSNSTATNALNAASITPPTDNGLTSAHWAPAAGNDLTSLTGNTLTITSEDNSGNVIGGLNITISATAPNVAIKNASGNTIGTESSTNNIDGTRTDSIQGYNNDGSTKYSQTNHVDTSGNVSATISGSGDSTDLNGVAVTLSGSAQASLNGSNDTISGGSSQITLGGGSSADSITGDNDTITGGANSNDTIISNYLDNTLDFGAGSTVLENLPLYGLSTEEQFAPASGVNSVLFNYDSLNGGGTLDTAIYNWGNNTSSQYVYTGLSSGVSQVVNAYSAPNDGGTLDQQSMDFLDGTSRIYVLAGPGLGSGQAEAINAYNASNNLTQQQINFTNGAEQLEIMNPAAGESEVLNEYSVANNSSSLTQQTIFDTNNTYSLEQIDPARSPNTVFSYYDGTAVSQASNPYQTMTEWGVGSGGVGSQVDTYAGFASTAFSSGAPNNVGEEIQNFSGVETGAVDTIFNFNSSSVAANGIGSEEDFFTNLPTNIDDISNGTVSTVTETIKDFASANGFQTGEIPDEKIFNLADGDSQQYYLNNIGQQGQATSNTDLFTNASATINEIIKDYNSLATNGAENGPEDKIFDYTDGDSEEFFMNNLSGQNLATSAVDLYSDQAGATIHDIEKGYSGVDGAANGQIPTDKIFDFNDGDSQEYFMHNLAGQSLLTSTTDDQGQVENIDEVIKSYDELGGATSGVSNLMNKVFDFTDGGSEESFMNNLSAQGFVSSATDIINGISGEGVSKIVEDFTGADGVAGGSTMENAVQDLSDGHSLDYVFDNLPSSNVSGVNVTGEINGYSQLDAAGELNDEILDLSNGNFIGIENNYNGAGSISYSENIFYNNSGGELGYQMYNGSGQLDGGNLNSSYGNFNTFSDGNYGYNNPSTGTIVDGGDGEIGGGNNGGGTVGDALQGSTTDTTTTGTTGTFSSNTTGGTITNEFVQPITSLNGKVGNSEIIQHDLQVGDTAAASIAEESQQEAYAIASGKGSAGATFGSGKWNSNVITWSMANSAGTAASPFSSYMGSQYQSLIQQAFQTWAAASGITFKQVSDSSASDIRIGWGDFDTTNTGVAGYTDYTAQGGQMQANTIIRLEDPSENALSGTVNGGTYAGTNATFMQVLLHEIGHALGLGDTADQNSIMYYEATANDRTLDSTDTQAIKALYDPSVQSSQQLIQAMAALTTSSGAASSGVSGVHTLFANSVLAAPQHAH